MDVVLPASGDVVDAEDEDLAYPDVHLYGAYAASKMEAERLVLAAHAPPHLGTAVVRPTGLYGERDPYHVPNVLRAARSWQLLMRLGSPNVVFQHTYVANVAHAHVCCDAELRRRPKAVGGRAFIVTDGPASNFFEFMRPFVEQDGRWFPPRWLFLPRAIVRPGARSGPPRACAHMLVGHAHCARAGVCRARTCAGHCL